MITTLTPNPSIDQTMVLSRALEVGSIHRPTVVTRTAGGKGINVTKAAQAAGMLSTAVFPAAPNDPFMALVLASGIRFDSVDIRDAVRISTAITDPSGTTTKFNGPGAHLTAAEAQQLVESFLISSYPADQVVLAGSLPGGLPDNWYATIIRQLRHEQPATFIGVDTSGAALVAIGQHLEDAAPDLLKPNAHELSELLNLDVTGDQIERAAAAGDLSLPVQAAQHLHSKGVRYVMVTLGGAGAILVSEEGTWHAQDQPQSVVSTVGAGDAVMTGFLLGLHRRAPLRATFAQAVAYGSAATLLPGTEMPGPHRVDPGNVTITILD